MKTKYNKRKYKMQSGVQRIENDSPDYSNAYKIRSEQNAKNQIGANIGAAAANIAIPGLGSALQGVGAISDSLTKDAKGNYKNKAAEVANTYTNPLATTSKALSALTGNKTAAADLFSESLIGTGLGALGMKNPFGKTTQEKVKEEAQKQEKITNLANINKRYTEGTATDAQAALAKKGKYKVKTKEPRPIEWEGGTNPDGSKRKNGSEAVFGPKKADGSRDLLYYNPDDPTHEAGGVPGVVVPKEMYNNGTNNLMPRRSKVSLLGSGNMAVGARQVKVKELNDTSLSQNLGGMPAVNAANKFVQPMAGIQQVARNIPEYRRKATIKNPMSQRKENPDTNRIINPPVPYELKPKPEKSHSKKVKVYK